MALKLLVEFPVLANGHGARAALGLAAGRAGYGRLSHAARASQSPGPGIAAGGLY
jgi:hypothetical protein